MKFSFRNNPDTFVLLIVVLLIALVVSAFKLSETQAGLMLVVFCLSTAVVLFLLGTAVLDVRLERIIKGVNLAFEANRSARALQEHLSASSVNVGQHGQTKRECSQRDLDLAHRRNMELSAASSLAHAAVLESTADPKAVGKKVQQALDGLLLGKPRPGFKCLTHGVEDCPHHEI